MKHLIVCILIICASSTLNAGVIIGKVTDTNGYGIDFANINIPKTNYNTSTNQDGAFVLNVKAGSYILRSDAIGYQSQSRNINIGETDTLHINFALQPEEDQLETIRFETKTIDRGVTIMKKVIASRKKYADKIKTLETDIYLKGSIKIRDFNSSSILGNLLDEETKEEMENALGINTERKGTIYALEQMTHYIYKAPNKTFNQVLSVRESGNANGLGFANMLPIINIYDNNIQILEGLNKRGFISPASNNAMLYYKFKYLGTMEDGDYKIHKIQVIPRRKFEPLFSGNVYVVDSLWLFQAVELTLTKESQIEVLDTLHFEQYFRPTSADTWLIKQQVLTPTITLMGFNGKGSFLTSYTNTSINQPIPDERFPNKLLAEYDSNTHNRDSAYWTSVRPIPLSKEEKSAYTYQDSLSSAFQNDTNETSPKKQNIGWNPIWQYRIPRWHFRIDNPLLTSGYNTVEGLFVNTNMSLDFDGSKTKPLNVYNNKKDWVATSNIRYGAHNNRWHANFSIAKYLPDEKYQGSVYSLLKLEAGSRMRQYNDSEPIAPVLDMLYTLFAGQNYGKYLSERGGTLSYTRKGDKGFNWSVAASYSVRQELNNASFYTFNQTNEAFTPNLPVAFDTWNNNTAAILNMDVSYQPGWQYIKYPKFWAIVKSNAPTFYANYTKGFAGIAGSQSNFDKWAIGIEHRIGLKLLGNIHYHLKAGGFINDASVHYADYYHLNGNQTFFASRPLHSFQLAPYYTFSNTHPLYTQAHAEWKLGGMLSNKLPIIRRLNWHLLAGNNTYYAQQFYYTEFFVGIENIGVKIYKPLRVDFVFGFENFSDKPAFGIRIGLKL